MTQWKLTSQWLKSKKACTDGFDWFMEHFGQEADIGTVLAKLCEEKQDEWANWILFRIPDQADFGTVLRTWIELCHKRDKTNHSTCNEAHASTQGDEAHASTQGDEAHASTQGDEAHASTQGDEAHASTQGNWAHASTQGNWAHASTQGYRSHASTQGYRSHAVCLGRGSRAQSGDKGIIAIVWYDAEAERDRMAVGYVGENGIKPHTWYRAEAGKLVECEVA